MSENRNGPENLKKLWSYGDLEAFTGLSPHTLRKWVSERRIPHIKLGGTAVRFDPSEIIDYVKSQHIDPVAQGGQK